MNSVFHYQPFQVEKTPASDVKFLYFLRSKKQQAFQKHVDALNTLLRVNSADKAIACGSSMWYRQVANKIQDLTLWQRIEASAVEGSPNSLRIKSYREKIQGQGAMMGLPTSTVLTIATEQLQEMQKAIDKANKQLRRYNGFWRYIFYPIHNDINMHYKQYLQRLGDQVAQLKRQAINTLFIRLEAALEKNDLLFDDVVVDACYAIKTYDDKWTFNMGKSIVLPVRPRRGLGLHRIITSLSLIGRLGDKQDQKRLRNVLTLQRDTKVPLHVVFYKNRASVYPESRHHLAIGWYRWVAPRSFAVLNKGLPLSMVLRCHQVARIRKQLAQADNTLDLFPHPRDVETGYGATPFLRLQAAEMCIKAHMKTLNANILTGIAKWIDNFFRLGTNQKLQSEVKLFEKELIELQKVKLQCFQRYVNYMSEASTPLSADTIVNARQCAKAVKQSLKIHRLYSGAVKLAYTAADNKLEIILAKNNTAKLHQSLATLTASPRRKKQPLHKRKHNHPTWLALAAGLPLPSMEQSHGQVMTAIDQSQGLKVCQKSIQLTDTIEKKKYPKSFDSNKSTQLSIKTSACQVDRPTASLEKLVRKESCSPFSKAGKTLDSLAATSLPVRASASHIHLSANNVSTVTDAIQANKKTRSVQYSQADENIFWVLAELAQGRVPDKQRVNNAFHLLCFYRDYHPDLYTQYQPAMKAFLICARHMINRLVKKELTLLWVNGKPHLARYQAIRAMLIGLRAFGSLDDQHVIKKISELARHHRHVGLFSQMACRDSVAMLESLITHCTVPSQDNISRSASLTMRCQQASLQANSELSLTLTPLCVA